MSDQILRALSDISDNFCLRIDHVRTQNDLSARLTEVQESIWGVNNGNQPEVMVCYTKHVGNDEYDIFTYFTER